MTTSTALDLTPATRELARVVSGIDDGQLAAPTPCADTPVGRLLAHVDGLSVAFARAAAKEPEGTGQGPAPEQDHVAAGWRERIPHQLAAMAQAWSDPAAWTGRTRIGGTDQSGEMCGLIGLNEVVVHGWDLARATGQSYSAPDEVTTAALGFVGPTAQQFPDGVPGLFGPVRPVREGATPLMRLLALTGRDPGWRAGA